MRIWFGSRDAAGGLDEVTMPFDRLQPRDEADQLRAFVQIQLSQQRRAPFRAAAAFQDRALDVGAQAVADDDDLLRRDMAAGQYVIANRFGVDEYAVRQLMRKACTPFVLAAV